MKFTTVSVFAILGFFSGQVLAQSGTCIPTDVNPNTKCGNKLPGCAGGQKCSTPEGPDKEGFCVPANIATNDGDCGKKKAGCPSGAKCQFPI